jgi:hypothetical protein
MGGRREARADQLLGALLPPVARVASDVEAAVRLLSFGHGLPASSAVDPAGGIDGGLACIA